MTCQRIGLPPISTSAFGIACVSSRSRVPLPPQRMATGMSAAKGELAPTGDGGKDRHFVTVGELGLEAVLKSDVLAGDVDVDEAAQGAVLGDALAKAIVLIEDRIESLAHGAAFDL